MLVFAELHPTRLADPMVLKESFSKTLKYLLLFYIFSWYNLFSSVFQTGYHILAIYYHNEKQRKMKFELKIQYAGGSMAEEMNRWTGKLKVPGSSPEQTANCICSS